jgi:hypothetical protein
MDGKIENSTPNFTQPFAEPANPDVRKDDSFYWEFATIKVRHIE